MQIIDIRNLHIISSHLAETMPSQIKAQKIHAQARKWPNMGANRRTCLRYLCSVVCVPVCECALSSGMLVSWHLVCSRCALNI